MNQKLTLQLNGSIRTAHVDPQTPLLYVLRDTFGLPGPKFGCGLAQCGACTVLLDGTAIRSCVTPVVSVTDHTITTVDGLGGPEAPTAVQQAFIAEQAAQCGYCIPGMMMAATALLRRIPHPSDAQIREALNGNLCRCGTHLRIIRAVRRAAGTRS